MPYTLLSDFRIVLINYPVFQAIKYIFLASGLVPSHWLHYFVFMWNSLSEAPLLWGVCLKENLCWRRFWEGLSRMSVVGGPDVTITAPHKGQSQYVFWPDLHLPTDVIVEEWSDGYISCMTFQLNCVLSFLTELH